jgi:hypothetical protein
MSTDPEQKKITIGERDAGPPVEPSVDRMVGEKLRNYFDALSQSPVPDRIVELIRALSEAESAKKEPEGDL